MENVPFSAYRLVYRGSSSVVVGFTELLYSSSSTVSYGLKCSCITKHISTLSIFDVHFTVRISLS